METNPLEPQPKKRPARRRLQFSMRALLLAPLILVIYVGLAVIIDAYAFSVSCRLFGVWLIDARHWLIGLGLSAGDTEIPQVLHRQQSPLIPLISPVHKI